MAVKRYNGTSWDIVAGVGPQGAAATSSSIATWVKTASGGETSVSGNDDNSQPLSYTVGQELVFINGALQKRAVDYTATTGTSITGLNALAAGDVVTVWTVNAFSVTNAISSGLVTTTGDMIYASSANVPARLGIGSTDQVLKVSGGIPAWGAAPAASFVGCRLTKSAVQSISNATDTNITWDTEAYDTDGFHSTTTNTSRITIPSGKAGKYLFHSMTIFGNSATGYRSSDFIKNGTTNITGGWFQGNLAANGYNGGTAITVADLAVGDYVELRVYQNSGGNLNFSSGTDTVFGCVYLGA